MSLRMPQSLSTSPRFESGVSILEAEIAQERAVALGRLGREIDVALDRLRRLDVSAPEREAAVQAAADATWSFFVQREACGLFDHDQAVAHYRIPAEVLARVGAANRPTRRESEAVRSPENPAAGGRDG